MILFQAITRSPSFPGFISAACRFSTRRTSINRPKKQPRKSGFLIPSFGNSSLHGKDVGFGYYWAISRSFDFTYYGQYFSQAGLANHAEFRGKINQKTDFDVTVFGIKDTNERQYCRRQRRSHSRGSGLFGPRQRLAQPAVALDYLSNFAFQQDFTQSFSEAISSETHSVGFVTKHWSDYGLSIAAQRDVTFQSTTPGDTIEVRKLPEVEFSGREHEYDVNGWPFWVSFDASAGT